MNLPTKINFKNLFDNIPLLLSTFGALALTLSIVYDFAFFTMLGTSFSEMPTSISDHIRSSLVWIPTTAIIVFILFVIELFNRRIEHWKTEEEIIATSPIPKFTKYFRASPKYLFFILSLTPLYLWFFHNILLPLNAWALTSMIFWAIFHNFLFHHDSVLKNISYEFYMLSRWIPLIFIYVFFNGAINAEAIKSGIGKKYSFELSIEPKLIHASLARSFNNHYLLWSKENNKIILVNSNNVIRLYPEDKN